MRNQHAKCANCAYWFPLNDSAQAGPALAAAGQCRERMHVVVLPAQRPTGRLIHGAPEMLNGVQVSGQLPMTTPDFVCGQHPDFFEEELAPSQAQLRGSSVEDLRDRDSLEEQFAGLDGHPHDD